MDPEAPDFSRAPKELSKLGGACISSVYKRHFVVDENTLRYYNSAQDRQIKGTYEMARATAVFHEKDEFARHKNSKQATEAERAADYAWTDNSL